jgi:RND family efflux transporter MFP subunit
MRDIMQRQDLPDFLSSTEPVPASTPREYVRHDGRRPRSTPGCLAIAGVVGLLLGLAACSRPAAVPEPVRAVRTVKVGAEALAGGVDYAGEVRARTESRLGFRVGGKLVRRAVELGDTVHAGQLLAQLDPQDLKLAQEAAQAGLLAAQTSHDQALADQRRTKELFDQGFVSAAELERRDNTLKSAAASLAQARAQLNVQGNQAGYAQLLADVSGVVTGVDAEPGAVLGAGTPVLRIAQDGARDVVFQVPEDKVKAMRLLLSRKNALLVSIWGSEQLVPATLRELAAAADPATRSFVAKADIGAADVRLGQTATVTVAAGQAAGAVPAIKLPLEAVSEQSGRTVVWLFDANSGTVQPQPVTLAAHEGRRAVIASGLASGQEVVVAGVHALSPGLKVKRYDEPAQTGAVLGSVAETAVVAARTAPSAPTALARLSPAGASSGGANKPAMTASTPARVAAAPIGKTAAASAVAVR